MRTTLMLCVLLMLVNVFGILPEDEFVRGDANNNGAVFVADASYISNWLFHGGPEPSCLDAADANDDGVIGVEDAVYIVSFLFDGGPPIPAPWPLCGVDPTKDSLDCTEHVCP